MRAGHLRRFFALTPAKTYKERRQPHGEMEQAIAGADWNAGATVLGAVIASVIAEERSRWQRH